MNTNKDNVEFYLSQSRSYLRPDKVDEFREFIHIALKEENTRIIEIVTTCSKDLEEAVSQCRLVDGLDNDYSDYTVSAVILYLSEFTIFDLSEMRDYWNSKFLFESEVDDYSRMNKVFIPQ